MFAKSGLLKHCGRERQQKGVRRRRGEWMGSDVPPHPQSVVELAQRRASQSIGRALRRHNQERFERKESVRQASRKEREKRKIIRGRRMTERTHRSL
jgi:hypothetical protein